MKKVVQSSLLLVLGLWAAQSRALDVKGYNLSQLSAAKYDANPAGQPKTLAQESVDYIYTLGARHVVLTPEARMASYTSTVIIPQTPAGQDRSTERARYIRLMQYIKSKGMSVGIRPIILVERTAGLGNTYWHGNIKPSDPFAWFASLREYLEIYATIAKVGQADEFTVGAELYSMTVGLEDQWPEQPYGFPKEWTGIVRDMKTKLGPATRIMYDINYTDSTANADGTGASGGEFERWRYRLADLKPNPANPKTQDPKSIEAWTHIKELWHELDAVGIDMYRSLLTKGSPIPVKYDDLVQTLQGRTDQFASDIDSKLFEIEMAVTEPNFPPRRIIIKEVGFKSCTGCFTDPFLYDDPRLEANIPHQAAAYQAFMNSFVKAGWSWLMGISWWHVSTEASHMGVRDPGFTPRGKPQTEEIIRKGWN